MRDFSTPNYTLWRKDGQPTPDTTGKDKSTLDCKHTALRDIQKRLEKYNAEKGLSVTIFDVNREQYVAATKADTEFMGRISNKANFRKKLKNEQGVG